MEWWLATILGIIGGLARACYGLMRAVSSGQEVRPKYFLITVVLAAFFGALLGVLLDVDTRIAALAGYVGTDILENFIPSVIPKSIKLNT
ncbi:MAG: hypothetical protein AABY00_01615 [Nanoarchaeota archaeon]